MFKYFSFKGVLFTVKKMWIVVCATVLLFAGIGVVLSTQGDVVQGISGGEFTSTRSYIVASDIVGEDNDTVDIDASNANTLVAILGDSACQYEIIDRMMSEYSNDDIAKYLNVAHSEYYTTDIFAGKLTINRVQNSPVINISIVSSDKKFGESVINYYSDYIEQNSDKYLKGSAKCEAINDLKTISTYETKMQESFNLSSAVKYAVVFGVLGAVLAVCLAAVVALFTPPVADAKSFEEYGLKVYSLGRSQKKEKSLFVRDAIKRDIESETAQNIAVISSLNELKICDNKKKVCEFLDGIDLDGIKFVNIENVSSKFAAFECVKECGSVILVEVKGQTKHSELESLLSLISGYRLNVIGVILA